MKTVTDIAQELMRFPEQDVLEVLDINSEDLVNRFMDKVEEKYDYLVDDFMWDEEQWDEDELTIIDDLEEYEDE